MSTVLLVGGAGFIGSHTAVELIGRGYDVVVADNLSNSDASVIDRIAEITGVRPGFFCADAADKTAMEEIFRAQAFDAVIHFGGKKSVPESVSEPISYYRNNIDTTLTILELMEAYGCKRMIFSSSAAVYGDASPAPYSETAPAGQCSNPYGRTKYMIEQILTDAAAADPELSVVMLRYFNPAGAHESGLIGERPGAASGNLMSYVLQVASGELGSQPVFGDDYPTPDGTGIRDYIHITDLAKGHAAALSYAMEHTGVETVNLGTGTGYSVLDVIRTFERVNGVKIPYTVLERRPGDVAVSYSDPSKAERLFGWRAEKSLEDMCRDAWRWRQNLNRGV